MIVSFCSPFGCSGSESPGPAGVSVSGSSSSGGKVSSATGGSAAQAGTQAEGGHSSASGGTLASSGGRALGGSSGGAALGGTSAARGGRDGSSGSTGSSGTAGQPAQGGGSSAGAAGVGGGGGGASGTAGSTGQPPAGNIPIFVALGHVGRTLVSCDDGLSWSLDRDEDPRDQISCKTDDCDHSPFSAKDFTFDAGWFITSLGWGNPSTVRRSQDGFHWETVATSREGADFDNIIGDGTGRFILLDRYDGRVSSDHGASWTKLAEIPLGSEIYNIRVAGFGDGKVIAFADERTIHWTADWGVTWQRPKLIEASCSFDFYNSGLASGKGRSVTVGTSGKGCYTADAAETFHGLDTTLDESVGQVIWTGSEFMIWGVNRVARSSDGVSWSSTATSLSPAGTFRPEAVAKAPSGAFVAASGQYESQAFFRSSDGVSWQRLTAAPKGHPIRKIVAGYAPADVACKP